MSKIIISQAQLLFVEDFLLGFPGPRTVETKSLEAEPVSFKTSLFFFFFLFACQVWELPSYAMCLKNHMKGSLLTVLGTWVSKS